MGYCFTLDNRDLPSTPDIVLPRHEAVIFVNGCFWHRHRNCRFAYTSKSRDDFWQAKFKANVAREKRVVAGLRRDGWRVWTVRKCQLRQLEQVAARLDHMISGLVPGH
jgi:DNA mismatch endonuclease (patch repair protein)